MQIKKRIINFNLKTSAYERNKLIRNEMREVHFKEILKGILVDSDGRKSMNLYENGKLEEAEKIEIYYL